jgi:hypothetical protein
MIVRSVLSYGSRPDDFAVGQRVATHPGTDAWMMGARYGEVVAVGRSLVTVRCDADGVSRRFQPFHLARLD